MGRPRKSAVLLEMTGTARDHPSRYADRPPEPETIGPIGDPPEAFATGSDAIKLTALWRTLTAQAPIGVLTFSDREALAIACRLGVESQRTGTKNQMRALDLYWDCLKGFGMTPDGRAIRGLGGKAPSKAANPLDAFKQKRRRAS